MCSLEQFKASNHSVDHLRYIVYPILSIPSLFQTMGRKPKAATAAATPEPKPATRTRRSTRRGRSDSESEEPVHAPPAVNYCEDSPEDSHSEEDYSPSKKSAAKRGAGRRGRGSSRGAAASSGSDREAAVRTPKAGRGGARGRRGGSQLASPVPKDLSVVMENSNIVEEEDEGEQEKNGEESMSFV